MSVCHLFIATRNAHKTRELAQILGPAFALEDLRAHPETSEVVEDGATFAENARIKAKTVSQQLPGLVLADDSGLVVDSLGGAPGVFSARYAGAEASDEANRQKLLIGWRNRDPMRTEARAFTVCSPWPGEGKCWRFAKVRSPAKS